MNLIPFAPEAQTVPSGVRLMPVVSDSMEPTFRAGDFAVVLPADRWHGEGVYVIDGLGEPAVYRLMTCATPGNLRVVPDNARYTSYEIARDDLLPRILGRVVGRVWPC